MKRDFLKNLGIEDEDVIKKILDENGNDVTKLKTQIATLEDDIKVKDGVIEAKKSEIDELKKVDVEALKTAEYERGKADGSAEIADFKKQNAIEKALSGYKAKDTSILSKMLDMSKVEFNDNFEIVKGLEEQIKPIQESHDYLFESDKPLPTFSGAVQGGDIKTDIKSVSLGDALKEKFK